MLLALLILASLAAGSALADEQDDAPADNPAAIVLDDEVKQCWQIGFVITAQGECRGITATAPAPMAWPEQQVRIVDEQVSANVRSINYRTLNESVTQMVVAVPRLEAGETATALITFEIDKRYIETPRDTSQLAAPKRPPRDLRVYLAPSPMIESDDRRIRALAEELTDQSLPAWEQVGKNFDWVRENVAYEFDTQLKGAVTALDDGKGDCEELTSLFIALCRAQKIPARAVWLPGHCYPEFYLEDAGGKGHWYPCQAAGADRDFGRMPEPRPILQKGDNFRVPGERKPQRYVTQTLKATHAAANPRVEFIMKQVEDE